MYKEIEKGICAPEGFVCGSTYAGIKSKKNEKPDMAIVYSLRPSSCASLFTTNKFCAAPVLLDREINAKGKARALVINSGNANAATGQQGLSDAREMVSLTAKSLKLEEDEVMVCSTGVIGQYLPMEKIRNGIETISKDLSADYYDDAAWAIMTTDTVRKQCAYELQLSGGKVKIGAMGKGSGMIHPNMATMLVFITCDAKVEASLLQGMLKEAVDETFNMLTVDGDTSTNDSLIMLANGASNVEISSKEDLEALSSLIKHICLEMTKKIARDGEGASHSLIVKAQGLASLNDARLVARSIAGSTLFKCALFGKDANWGRIMAAAGYSGADIDPSRADCFLESEAGKIQVMKEGFGLAFDEEKAKEILSQEEIIVTVDFHSGEYKANAYGCDMTYDYVKINGDYRS